MKTKINITLKIIFFVLILGFLLYASTIVLRRKDSLYKYADFFKLAKEDQIDVLFLGSSHVINAVNPAVLYDEYGYTSYNMGGHGSLLQATYWELMESLEYTTPKWVVVDAYMIEKDYRYLDDRDANPDDNEVNTSIEQLHLNMDVWPLNKTKIAAVKDLILDKDIQREFLVDFSVYHNRWEYITEDDFKSVVGSESRNELFGAEMRYDVETAPPICAAPEKGETLENQTVGEEYLAAIIEECKKRNINVLVTYLPFAPETKDIVAATSAGQIAKSCGVPYLNMLNDDVIDIYKDLNDHGHLNAVGASKVTCTIGEWLSKNSKLEDHRNDSNYAYWEELSSKYVDSLEDIALNESNLFTKLNILSLGDYGVILYCNNGSQVFTDKPLKHVISAISDSKSINMTMGPYIMIYDPASAKVYEASGTATLDGIPTAMGELNYQPVEQKFRRLYTSDDEETNYLYSDEHADEDIQLIIYDKETGEVLKQDYFTSKGGKYDN
ncbi:MAG: hypothetical protein J5802_13945 [Butyrivibrio sp.]|nr:hypothetical protein [Butyrivibrio sp.]